MKDILTESGLYGYAEGTIPAPVLDADGGNAAAVDAWIAKDAKALTAIRTRVSQSMMTYVIGAEHAKDAWSSLKAIFDVQGPIAIVLERRRFFRYAIPEGADIEEHTRALSSSKEKLSLLGKPVSNEDFNLTLLTALPESWDSFVASIDVSALSDPKTNLIGRLLQEDARRRSRSGVTAAFPVYPTPGNQKPPAPLNPPRSQSNQPRQFNGGARFPQRGSGNSRGTNNRGRPNLPRSRGAFAPRFNPSNNRPPPNHDQPAYSFMARIDEVEVFTAIPPTRKWIGDTGSQVHIVSDRSFFETYEATPGRTISGIGSAKVLGVGTIRLYFLVDGHRTGRITLVDVLHVPSISHHLISLGRLTSGTGLAYMGIDDVIEIYDARGNAGVIGLGNKVNQLYEFDIEPVLPVQSFLSVLAEPGTTGTSRSAT